jgi:hypothetical protein
MIRLCAIWRHFSQAVLRQRGWLPEQWKTGEVKAGEKVVRPQAAQRGTAKRPRATDATEAGQPELSGGDADPAAEDIDDTGKTCEAKVVRKQAAQRGKAKQHKSTDVKEAGQPELSGGGALPAAEDAEDADDDETFEELFGPCDDTCKDLDNKEGPKSVDVAASASSSSARVVAAAPSKPSAVASASSSGGSPSPLRSMDNSQEGVMVMVPAPPPLVVKSGAPHDARDFWQTAADEMDSGLIDDNMFSCFEFMEPPSDTAQDALTELQAELDRDRVLMPPPPGPPKTYVYGYDDTQGKAFRKPSKQPRAPPEWADDIIVNNTDPDTAPAIAVFSDGSKWAIATLTKGDLLAKRGSVRPRKLQPPAGVGGKAKKGNKNNIFDGVHSKTQGRVRVVWLKAESLWSLKLKYGVQRETQICQCSEQSVGSKDIAGEILSAVAKEYCEDKWLMKDLYDRRDQYKQDYMKAKLASAKTAAASSAPDTAGPADGASDIEEDDDDDQEEEDEEEQLEADDAEDAEPTE